MTQHSGVFLALILLAVASCVDSRNVDQTSTPHPDQTATDDRAVLEVVLGDFANWNDATFGNQAGVLALNPLSADLNYRTVPDTRRLVSRISDLVSDDLIVALLERNLVQTDLTSLVAGSKWVRIYTPPRDFDIFPALPDGAKALGSVSLPGFSPDGTSALVQINHSWSIHGAVVTYVLSKHGGNWEIRGRDQTVFL
jgi:hypothetical protein